MARHLFLVAALFFCGVIVDKTFADEPEKIVGGTDAAPGEIPYQVSLRRFGTHFCGGSLISSRHVLTAAHCVIMFDEPYDDLTVVSGSTKLSSGGESHEVKKISIHEDYINDVQKSLRNDIAVITLTKPYRLSRYQRPIGFGSVNPRAGSALLLSGWGKTSVNGPIPNKLQKATVFAMTNPDCQNKMSPQNILYDTNICSINKPGIGACPGDSGGPLVYHGQVVGIVSMVYPCALGMPDIYTRVSKYLNFIHEAMGS